MINYLSLDSIVGDSPNDHATYPIGFSNILNVSGLPLYKIVLKIGAIVILLRNLNVESGLMNNTRMKMVRMHEYCLHIKILTGLAKEERIILPCIDNMPLNTLFPFQFKRQQFLIKLAYAVSINKSQGQTLDRVGIYLPSPVFSHGQLYVAMSRVRASQDLKIQICNTKEHGMIGNDGSYTRNVVYPEILN